MKTLFRKFTKCLYVFFSVTLYILCNIEYTAAKKSLLSDSEGFIFELHISTPTGGSPLEVLCY